MNLFYTHLDFYGDATDVPVGVGSCHLSAEVTNIPFVSAGQAGTSSVVSVSGWPEFGFLFVTVFKTLNCCHLDV